MSKEEFFKKLALLSELKPLTAKKVGDILSLSLSKHEAESDEFFEVYVARGQNKNGLHEAELRVPAHAAEARDGMLILELAPTLDIKLEEIMERFGNNPGLSPPHPRAPQASPVYYYYNYRGAKLSFGFKRGEAPRLTSVVIDRTETDN